MVEVKQTNQPLKTIEEIKDFLKKHPDIVHFQVMTNEDLENLEKLHALHLGVPKHVKQIDE